MGGSARAGKQSRPGLGADQGKCRGKVCSVWSGPIGGKPPPTLDRVHTVKMWQGACSRLGRRGVSVTA
ncbi:hypothetical protein PFWH6_5459 [Pseudomonas fluorescens WH6]|nr:hypothetical protein PFWH6_5459 [Pseudomonas fluorescens WH6]